MKSFAALALFVAVAVGQNTLQINTPSNVVECEPTLLSWSGGTPPYFLSILPGNQPSAAALENLGQQTGTSYTWNTDIAAGTSVGLTLRDSTGATASSAPFTINGGSSSSCVGQGQSSSAAGSASAPAGSSSSAAGSSSSAPASTSPGSTSAPATTPASSTTPAGTSTRPASSSSSSRPASSGSTSSAASASTSSSAAKANLAGAGVAGVIGAAVAAILA